MGPEICLVIPENHFKLLDKRRKWAKDGLVELQDAHAAAWRLYQAPKLAWHPSEVRFLERILAESRVNRHRWKSNRRRFRQDDAMRAQYGSVDLNWVSSKAEWNNILELSMDQHRLRGALSFVTGWIDAVEGFRDVCSRGASAIDLMAYAKRLLKASHENKAWRHLQGTPYIVGVRKCCKRVIQYQGFYVPQRP